MITPITLILTLTAAAAGYNIGSYTRRNLDRLSYRQGDERERPCPTPRRWVPWVSASAAATIPAVGAFNAQPLLYLPLLPLALAGPWLAAVDLDVQRLPNRVTGLLAAAVAGLVVLVTIVTGVPAVAVYAVLGGILAGVVYLASHLLTRGGLGMGDVKLATVSGLTIGTTGLSAVVAAIMIGSLAAIIWAKTTRHTGPLPYGPWLLLGTWAGTLLTALVP